MNDQFELIRLVGTERRLGSTLKSISRHWQNNKESFLFISPHDDDAVGGAGLMIQLARKENIPVHILIVTDGSMGYCSKEEKDKIADIRKAETFECYQSLGVPKENIAWLGFPDCQLNLYRGRRPANADDKAVIKDFTGTQNAFTYYLRKAKPTQCFLPTSSDLHPDHRIVHEEFLISIFHAAGSIWPELGDPIEKPPYIHEFACYCNFPQPPQLRIQSPMEAFEKKLNALAAFRSQRQIEATTSIIRNAGPLEYIRELEFKLYNPFEYKHLFDDKGSADFLHR